MFGIPVSVAHNRALIDLVANRENSVPRHGFILPFASRADIAKPKA
jgi:hypothetical protein